MPGLTFPNVIFTPPGAAPQAPFAGALTPEVPPFSTQLAHGLVPDFVNPLVHEGEFTIEQQLGFNTSLSLGYLFARGLHLPVFVDSTLAPATSTGQPVFATISGFPSGGADYGVTGGEVTNTGGSTGGRPPQFGRNVFIGPGLTNVDFRIMRQFTLKERFHLQVPGEAFNLFNDSNFSSVNGTEFNYSAVGSGACTAAIATGTSGCIIPNAAFLAPTGSTSTNGLYASRQLQMSLKLTF